MGKGKGERCDDVGLGDGTGESEREASVETEVPEEDEAKES